MSLPPPPNITQGQIALDPVNGVVYYKNDQNQIVATTWTWLRDNASAISTDDNVTIASDLTISGNLTVAGDTVSLNVSQMLVEDNYIILNSNLNTGIPTLDSGIQVKRGSENTVSIRWNETINKWQYTNDGITFEDIGPSGFAGSLSSLSDVTVSSPEEFQSLIYDGTEWVNKYAPVVSYVRNADSVTLQTGTVVYLFGGTGDHATVKRADNSSDTTSSKTVGVIGSPIAPNEHGPVVTRGYVDGIDLNTGYSAGDVLWLGTNGQFTKTKPTAPKHLVFVGVVTRATNNGIIYVATQNGYELDELHDVSIATPNSGDILAYNGSLWSAVPSSNTQAFTTSGTTVWNKPNEPYTLAKITCIGGGGGGAAGRVQTTGSGGGGGQGGERIEMLVKFSDLPSTLNVTVGAGGNGGTGNGGAGVDGGVTTVSGGSILIIATGGERGGRISPTSGGGQGVDASYPRFKNIGAHGLGTVGGIVGDLGSIYESGASPMGGCGGGRATGNGGTAASGILYSTLSGAGGIVGSGSTNGTDGGNSSGNLNYASGAAGGGGGGGSTANGGKGGNGIYGSGGAGGGGAVTGYLSGDGGKGGDGVVVITCW